MKTVTENDPIPARLRDLYSKLIDAYDAADEDGSDANQKSALAFQKLFNAACEAEGLEVNSVLKVLNHQE